MGRKPATHCKAGHELNAENRMEHKRGNRIVTECRLCAAARKRAKRALDSPKLKRVKESIAAAANVQIVQNVQDDVPLMMNGRRVGHARVGGLPIDGANIFGVVEDGKGGTVSVSAVIDDESLAAQVGASDSMYCLARAGSVLGIVDKQPAMPVSSGPHPDRFGPHPEDYTPEAYKHIWDNGGVPLTEHSAKVDSPTQGDTEITFVETHGSAPAPGLIDDQLGSAATFPSPQDFGIGGVQRIAPPVQPRLTESQPQSIRPPRTQPAKCPHGFPLATMCPQCRAAS